MCLLVTVCYFSCVRINDDDDMQKTVSSQSPLCQSGRKREDLWWEGFVKEVGFELGVKE